MKILILSNKLPYAEIAGGHRIIFQRILHLAQAGHQIGLLCFSSPEKKEKIEDLKPFLSEYEVLPKPHRNILTRILHDYIFPSRPAIIWKNYSKQMMKAVGEAVERSGYDVVIAEFSEMGQYLYKNPFLSAVHKVISCHHCLTTAFEQYIEKEKVDYLLYLKSLPQIYSLRRYEFAMYRSMDRIFVLTPQDRFTLQHYAQDLPVSIVPAGVDINYLQAHPPVPKEPIVLMTGYMGDAANEDAVEWFCAHIWPRLKKSHPDLKFYVVGGDPGRHIRRIAAKDRRIVLSGYVKDLRPFRNRARVFVAPIRLGSGLRPKVIEAMASALPVVGTALAMAGIQAQTGVNCFVADTPELFAQSVEWLLTDRGLSARMARAAAELAENHHALADGMERFENILHNVVAR